MRFLDKKNGTLLRISIFLPVLALLTAPKRKSWPLMMETKASRGLAADWHHLSPSSVSALAIPWIFRLLDSLDLELTRIGLGYLDNSFMRSSTSIVHALSPLVAALKSSISFLDGVRSHGYQLKPEFPSHNTSPRLPPPDFVEDLSPASTINPSPTLDNPFHLAHTLISP